MLTTKKQCLDYLKALGFPMVTHVINANIKNTGLIDEDQIIRGFFYKD